MFIGWLSALPACLIAQPISEVVKQPPSWPSPQEYLANKRREADHRPGSVDSVSREASVPELTSASPADREQTPLPAYTVQIGAYRDYERALTTVRRADQAGLLILRSSREDETWHVVVLGLYATRAEAAAAEVSYLSAHPGAATWLRSTSTLSVASGRDGG